ncbi:hypothetical protein ACI65C_006007 [Semiaphis heraclei]
MVETAEEKEIKRVRRLITRAETKRTIAVKKIRSINDLAVRAKDDPNLMDELQVSTSTLDDLWAQFEAADNDVLDGLLEINAEGEYSAELPAEVLNAFTKKIPFKPTTTSLVISKPSSSKSESCPNCRGKHAITDCRKFASLSVEDRNSWARDNGVCYTCLSSNHWADKCHSKLRLDNNCLVIVVVFGVAVGGYCLGLSTRDLSSVRFAIVCSFTHAKQSERSVGSTEPESYRVISE